MKINPKIKKYGQMIAIIGWLLLLFLISLNFLNIINELMVRFLWYTGFLVIILWHKPTFNLEFVLLLAFGTAYFFLYIQYRDYSKWTHIKYWLGAPGMYLLGKTFITQKTLPYYRWVIFAVVFGLFSYASLNMIDYIYDENLGEGTRVAYDFWVGHAINAPLMGVYITGIGTLTIYNVFHLKWKKDWFIKIVQFVGLFLSIYYSIMLANRTYFYILMLLTGVLVLMEIILNFKKSIIPLLSIVGVGLLIYWAYQINLFGMTQFIEGTLWFRRVIRTLDRGIWVDPRFEIYPLVWEQFKLFPLGGYQMDLGPLVYAHNLWLDVLFAVGHYPFYMITTYTALTLFTLVRMFISKHITLAIKMMALSVTLGYYINFMVEPILEGVPYIFFLICLINGATFEYVKQMNQKNMHVAVNL